MANFSVRAGYKGVASEAHAATAPTHQSLSDQVFTFLALSGGVAGVFASTAIESANPAITGLFCTVIGSATATAAWCLGQTAWNKTQR